MHVIVTATCIVALLVIGGPMLLLGILSDSVVAAVATAVLLLPLFTMFTLQMYPQYVSKTAFGIHSALLASWSLAFSFALVGWWLGNKVLLVVSCAGFALFCLMIVTVWALSIRLFIKSLGSSDEHVRALAKKFKTTLLGLLGIVIMFVLLLGYLLHVNRNYAQEVAMPIEKRLIAGGATKICEINDNGKSSMGSREPYYAPFFEFKGSQEQVMSLLKDSFEEAGYRFSKASVENRGNLGVADAYIDSWYFNDIARQQPFTELEDGIIHIEGYWLKPGELVDGRCKKDAIRTVTNTSDSNATVFSVHVKLPRFKG